MVRINMDLFDIIRKHLNDKKKHYTNEIPKVKHFPKILKNIRVNYKVRIVDCYRGGFCGKNPNPWEKILYGIFKDFGKKKPNKIS